MPFDSFDSEPAPAQSPSSLDWNPSGETPAHLRDYWTVHRSAEPIHLPGPDAYAWVAAPGVWCGVDPPRGIIPPELFEDIVFVTRFTDKFATRGGALAALQVAILRWENGSWQRKVVVTRSGGH